MKKLNINGLWPIQSCVYISDKLEMEFFLKNQICMI